MNPVLTVLTVIGWATVGAVLGVVGTRMATRRAVVSAGRAARAPVCNSCPFVTPEQRLEIASGNPAEIPPALALPMLDGSGYHRPV